MGVDELIRAIMGNSANLSFQIHLLLQMPPTNHRQRRSIEMILRENGSRLHDICLSCDFLNFHPRFVGSCRGKFYHQPSYVFSTCFVVWSDCTVVNIRSQFVKIKSCEAITTSPLLKIHISNIGAHDSTCECVFQIWYNFALSSFCVSWIRAKLRDSVGS